MLVWVFCCAARLEPLAQTISVNLGCDEESYEATIDGQYDIECDLQHGVRQGGAIGGCNTCFYCKAGTHVSIPKAYSCKQWFSEGMSTGTLWILTSEPQIIPTRMTVLLS